MASLHSLLLFIPARICSCMCVLATGKMAPKLLKGDIRVLFNKREETTLSFEPVDKAARKTLALLKLAPKHSTKALVVEELARHQKQQRVFEGEAKLSGSSSLADHETYSVKFQDLNFRSDLFIDDHLHSSSKRHLLDLGQPTTFHWVECHALQLAADCHMLEADTVTRVTKMKQDYEVKLDRTEN